MQQTVQANADLVLSVLDASDQSEYIGEPISQLEHALQAAHFARRTAADAELIIAALLHDVGHLIATDAPNMEGLGTINHEGLGAAWLAGLGFSGRVCDIVNGHVAAKRYLCYRKPAYFDRLSDASRGTLEWQGGPMSQLEAQSFEQQPCFKDILAVRQWDEMAKRTDITVARLSEYRAMIIDHLSRGA